MNNNITPAIATGVVAGITDFILDRKLGRALILASIVGITTYIVYNLTRNVD